MSATSCLLEAIEKVKRSKTLTQAEQQEVIDRLKEEIKASKGTAEQQVAKALLAAREAARDVFAATVGKAKSDARDAAMSDRMAGESGLSAADYLAGRVVRQDSYSPNPTTSVEDIINATEAGFRERLNSVLEMLYEPVLKGATYKQTSDGARIRAVLHGGTDPNPRIVNAAGKVRAFMKEVAIRKRAAGVFVELRDDYWPLSHNFPKMQASREEWFQFMEDKLDPKEFPDPRAYAEHLYRRVGGRTALSKAEFRPGQAPRFTGFKDPADLGEYADRFGGGTFADELQDMITGAARELALVETFGPRPTNHMDKIVTIVDNKLGREKGEAAREGRSTKPYIEAEEKVTRAKQALEAYMYPADDPLNATTAWIQAGSSVGRAYVLGMAVTWDMLFDPVVIFNSAVLRGGLANAARQTVDSYLTYLSSMKTAEGRAYLEGFGVQLMSINATLQNSYLAGDFAAQVNPTSGSIVRGPGAIGKAQAVEEFGRKANGVVQRVTMATHFRRRNHAVAAITAARNMAEQAKRGWSDVRPAYRTLLQSYGINESVWAEVRQLPVDKNGALDTRNAAPWLRELVKSAMVRDGRNSINMPGMREREQMGSFARRMGTLGSLGKSIITPFVGYPLSFMNNAMQQQMRLGGWGAVGFVGSAWAACMVLMQVRLAIQGKPTYDWMNPELWWRGALGAGFAGPLGESLAATVLPNVGLNEGGKLLPLTVVGKPINDLYQVTKAVFDDDFDKAAFMGIKTVADSIPNLLPIEVFKHRAMHAVAESLYPEYAERQERLADQRAIGIFEDE